MSTIRSSVNPSTPKLPWGTILKPEFGMGHQKMSESEIDQTVNRLYKIPEPKERNYPRNGPVMEQSEVDEMLRRLTTVEKEKIPDHDRRLTSSSYNQMGVVSSYAWQGYN